MDIDNGYSIFRRKQNEKTKLKKKLKKISQTRARKQCQRITQRNSFQCMLTGELPESTGKRCKAGKVMAVFS